MPAMSKSAMQSYDTGVALEAKCGTWKFQVLFIQEPGTERWFADHDVGTISKDAFDKALATNNWSLGACFATIRLFVFSQISCAESKIIPTERQVYHFRIVIYLVVRPSDLACDSNNMCLILSPWVVVLRSTNEWMPLPDNPQWNNISGCLLRNPEWPSGSFFAVMPNGSNGGKYSFVFTALGPPGTVGAFVSTAKGGKSKNVRAFVRPMLSLPLFVNVDWYNESTWGRPPLRPGSSRSPGARGRLAVWDMNGDVFYTSQVHSTELIIDLTNVLEHLPAIKRLRVIKRNGVLGFHHAVTGEILQPIQKAEGWEDHPVTRKGLRCHMFQLGDVFPPPEPLGTQDTLEPLGTQEPLGTREEPKKRPSAFEPKKRPSAAIRPPPMYHATSSSSSSSSAGLRATLPAPERTIDLATASSSSSTTTTAIEKKQKR